MRYRQLGVSLLGLIAAAVVLIFGALLGMKLVPAYLEYNAISKAITGISADNRGRNASPADIRRSFDSRAAIDDFTSVKASDLEITKDGNDYAVSAAWRREVPLFSNIGVYIDFTASSAD
jgi:hypothetical protein